MNKYEYINLKLVYVLTVTTVPPTILGDALLSMTPHLSHWNSKLELELSDAAVLPSTLSQQAPGKFLQESQIRPPAQSASR